MGDCNRGLVSASMLRVALRDDTLLYVFVRVYVCVCAKGEGVKSLFMLCLEYA